MKIFLYRLRYIKYSPFYGGRRVFSSRRLRNVWSAVISMTHDDVAPSLPIRFVACEDEISARQMLTDYKLENSFECCLRLNRRALPTAWRYKCPCAEITNYV